MSEQTDREHNDYKRALEFIASASESAIESMAREVVRKAQLIAAEEAIQARIKELPELDRAKPLYAIRYICLTNLIESIREDIDHRPDLEEYRATPLFSAYAQPDGSFMIYRDKYSKNEVEQLTSELCFVAGAEFSGFGGVMQQIEGDRQKEDVILGGPYRYVFNTTAGEGLQFEQDFMTNERGEVTHITMEAWHGRPESTSSHA